MSHSLFINLHILYIVIRGICQELTAKKVEKVFGAVSIFAPSSMRVAGKTSWGTILEDAQKLCLSKILYFCKSLCILLFGIRYQ